METTRRLAKPLAGVTRSLAPDPELQALVRTTAEGIDAPIAIVSLMLERVQLFRAHHGLPPVLVASRAIEREASFCALTLREGRLFEIRDTAADPAIPQQLVTRYGIRSYLGMPIEIGGVAVGTICVFGHTPRTYTATDGALLAHARDAAAKRLSALSIEGGRSLHEVAVRPQFAELRNRLQPMIDGVASMQIALAELQAVHRVTEYVTSHPEEQGTVLPLETAQEALRDLEDCLAEVASDVTHVHRAVLALESASVAAGTTCLVNEIVDAASTLAYHHTKLAGGLHWPRALPNVILVAPVSIAVNAVAAAVSGLANEIALSRGERGIAASFVARDGMAGFRLEAPDLDAFTIADHAAQLARLVGDDTVMVRHDASALELVFASAG
jgi:hypothetical protein